ncbi:MAG: 4Fe-4S dicluster domain-containing protein [Aigarchaeota archaeon]|nr:4Fe-4S dicluster domain-containing protein [Aigarchaeota archaeon]
MEKTVASAAPTSFRRKALACFQCGECAGSCPLFIVAPQKYNPRRILWKLAFSGEKPHDVPWLCLTCYECFERCPADVSMTELMVELKNEASRKGEIPVTAMEVAERLLHTGKAVPVTKSIMRTREELGLKSIPDSPNQEVIELLEAVGFKKMVDEWKHEGRK